MKMNSNKDIVKESDLSNMSKSEQPVSKSKEFSLNSEYDLTIPRKRKSNKKTIVLLIILLLVILGGFFAIKNIGVIKEIEVGFAPTPTPVPTPTPTPSPTPQALNKSEWSFEILNGSGVTGEAKKIADSIKALGYQVVKSGNADKQSYTKTQIFVKSDLKDKLDLVVADLKDVIKVASYAGELKDSTASARIIIGKDSI